MPLLTTDVTTLGGLSPFEPAAAKGQAASREEVEKERKAQDESADIMGKSRFKMKASVPVQQERTTPLTATQEGMEG